MSRIPAIEVFPESHWNAMAVQMSEFLRQVAAGTRAIKDFPGGVLTDAEAFMDSACEEASYRLFGAIPSNPQACEQNYELAEIALCSTDLFVIGEASGENRNFALFVILYFLNSLRDPRKLTRIDKRITIEIADFFKVLAEVSEE